MITKKKKQCSSCKNDSYIFSKGRCKSCSTKEDAKSIKKSNKPIPKYSVKGLLNKEKKKEYTIKQFEMFDELWKERSHYCYETNQFLGYEPLSTMFHHCLFKSKYPEYALIKENIVLLHPDVHAQVHVDSSKTPKVREYTQKLKEKYEIN